MSYLRKMIFEYVVRHENKVGEMKHSGKRKQHSKKRVTPEGMILSRLLGILGCPDLYLIPCLLHFTKSSMNTFVQILKIITLCYESKFSSIFVYSFLVNLKS